MLEAALGAQADAGLGRAAAHERRPERALHAGGIVTRAIRSHQLWLTVGYFAALLLLARAYA